MQIEQGDCFRQEGRAFVDGIHFKHVSEFRCIVYVLDESCIDEAECSSRRVAGAIRPLVNARSLQLECAKVLHNVPNALSG